MSSSSSHAAPVSTSIQRVPAATKTEWEQQLQKHVASLKVIEETIYSNKYKKQGMLDNMAAQCKANQSIPVYAQQALANLNEVITKDEAVWRQWTRTFESEGKRFKTYGMEKDWKAVQKEYKEWQARKVKEYGLQGLNASA